MALVPLHSLVPNFADDNGRPLAGGTLQAFIAGTSTATTFYDVDGDPLGVEITLDARGEPPTKTLFVDSSITYKFRLADKDDAQIWLIDNITVASGAGSGQWVSERDAEHISATQFRVDGDLTTGERPWTVGDRVRAQGDATGTIYGTVSAISYAVGTDRTTVTVAWDSGALSNEALTVWVSIQTVAHGLAISSAYLPSSAEIAAGIAITDYRQPPGDIRRYGGKPDGSDTSAVAAAAAPVAAAMNVPLVFAGGRYAFASQVTLSDEGLHVVGRSATLELSATFDDGGSDILGLFDVTAHKVVIESLTFDGSSAVAESLNNRFVWITADECSVRNCAFNSLPNGGSNFNGAVGFSAATERGLATGNRFFDCPGAVFTQGPRTVISDNIATSPKDVSFAVNSPGAIGCSVIGNKVYAADLTCSIHIGIEEGAQKFSLIGNYVYGVKDGIGIGCVTVAVASGGVGGVIADNIVDGGGYTSTNPSALLDVGKNYSHIKVRGNILMNGPAGNSNNICAGISSTNSEFRDNKIIAGASAVGYCVYVRPAGGELLLEGNDIDADGLSYAVRVTVGDNGGVPLRSYRNIYRNAAEGINITQPTNMPLYQEDDDFEDGIANAMNGVDWQNYFNAYKTYRFPHKISVKRVLYGNKAPTSGIWQTGDTVYDYAPSAGGAEGWKCVIGGSPGTWKSFGSISA